MKNRKLIIFSVVFVIILVLSSVFTGCTSATTTTAKPTAATTAAEQPKSGGTVTQIQRASPGGNIGWPIEFAGGDATSSQMFYEGLQRGLRDGTYEPMLATSYELAADQLSATYKLRQGVKFHDGTPFNADAAKWNLDKVIEAKRQTYWKSVDVIDPYTIRINFTEYRNGILYSGAGNWMVSPTAGQKGGNLDYIRQNPTGTGPFMFVSFQKDVAMVGKKNPDYWMKGKPYVDNFKIKYVPDWMTQKAAMQAGEGDFLSFELGQQAKEFMDMGFNVQVQHQAIFTIMFDTKNETSPFRDKRVREAVEYAINKEEIAKNLGFGLFKVPYSLISFDNAAYTPDIKGRVYDVAKAKALLKEAGYPDGLKTTFTPIYTSNAEINLAIKGYLDKAGILTTINTLPQTQFLALTGGKFEGMMLESYAALANFATSLSMYLDQKGIFYPNMDKPNELQAYLDKLAKSPNYPDIALIRETAKYIEDNALCIPIHDGGMSYGLGKRVQGKAFLVRDFPPWVMVEEIWVKD
jgi:peptide/nickel transport system substrate-binding protein